MAGALRADWIAGERSQLGRYQLIRRLATGGMAEIYLARATAIEGFEKLVVLKRILPQHADNESFIRMFLAEARLAATLHHPNVVQVYDIGEDDGTYFFAMEYIEGVDLRQLYNAARRAGQPLPLQHILTIITGVCAGLHYAHDKKDPSGTPLGIVHRDVSPSNVLVTFDGGVKLVDFGIAKAANVSTTTGTLKGKIPYMSPEQCRGAPLDRRSDVFSIGTLLWELTTGTRLFSAENELALLGRVAQGDISAPSTVCPGYPPALEPIVLRALAVDLDQRYATAQQLQLALEDFAHEARLPLSAARLQPFLREVCAEQIARLDALLVTQPPQATTPSPQGPGMASGTATRDPGSVPGPGAPKPAGPAHEVTAVSPTSGPGALPVTATIASPRTRAAAPRRRMGVAVGLMAALGLGVAGWWLVVEDEPSAPSPTAAPGSAAEADPGSTPAAPAAPDPPEEASAATPSPADLSSPDDPATSASPAATDDDPAAGETDAPEPSPDPSSDLSPAPATASPRPRRSKRGGSSRSTSREASGKSAPSAKPSKESKSTWDPKAAPPPGL